MRKMLEIATPLSRLAMTSKWDSSGSDPFTLETAQSVESHINA